MDDVSTPAACLGSPDPEPRAGNYFVSTYPPFSCWTPAATRDFQARLQTPAPGVSGGSGGASGLGGSAMPDAALGIYVHVPFCADRCHYCYYLSHDRRGGDIESYLAAVTSEVCRYATGAPLLAGRLADFVYIGGGTPSVLSASRLSALMTAIGRAFPYDRAREVCVECAPRSATPDRLSALRDTGVTRVSLGVQQMDDTVLAKNGRIHLVRDVETAFARMRDTGFPVVNLDLIAGLVGETDETFFASLDRVIQLGPESVTIYQLEIPQNTPLYRALPALPPADAPAGWAEKRARVDAAFTRLEIAGYTRRSAYAAVRDPARHQFIYQDAQYGGADLLGVGVSAFSCVAGVNQQNVAALDAYLAAMQAGEWPHWRAFVLSPRERMVRELVLQLKLGSVERARFQSRHGEDPVAAFDHPLREAERSGLVCLTNAAITVTRAGLLSVDRWLQAFYEPAHRGVRYS